MKKLVLKAAVLVILISLIKPVFSQQSSVSYTNWQNFLTQYVTDDGKVNYSLIIKHPEELNQFISIISVNRPTKEWKDAEQKAYWINAYNAFTIKLVLDNYPIKSLKDIKSAFKSPWDNTFIIIKGKNISLNDIENNMLFKEKHCPPDTFRTM